MIFLTMLLATPLVAENSFAQQSDRQSANKVQSKNPIKTQFSFIVGGGVSKDFERVREKKYPQMEVILTVDGLQGSVTTGGAPGAKYVIGAETAKGIAVLQLLENEKPWNWRSMEAIPLANDLRFVGRVDDNIWVYSGVYPDLKIESFLRQIKSIMANP